MDDAEMVDYLRRCALEPDQPRPSIETLLHAFVPAAHVDHTHPDAVIALTSSPRRPPARRRRRSATRRCGSTTSGPASTCRSASPSSLEAAPAAHAPSCSTSTGSSPGARPATRRYRSTLEFVDTRRRGDRAGGDGGFGLGGAQGRAARRPGGRRPARGAPCPALRGALLADADGVVLEVDRSPEAVAFALLGAGARGEPDRRAVPRPPDPHEAQAARRRLRPRRGRSPDELAAALRAGVDEYAAWYRDYYERNLTDESRPFPIDPAGPRVVLVPGRRHRHERRRRGPRARSRATSTTVRSPSQDAADAVGGFRSLSEAEAFAIEYWPLERYKLAQAPPRGELAGRDRARHRRRAAASAARPRAGSPSSARTSSSPTSTPTAPSTVADEIVAAHGRPAALAVAGRRHERGRRRGDGAPDRARLRRPRHPRLLAPGSPSSAPVTETTARRVGAEPRRARARLLPGRARGVPRARRSRAAAARSSSSARRTRSSPARTRPRTPPPRPPRCTSPAASPRRAASTASASTPSTRTRSSRARASGRRSGRPSARAPTALAEEDLPAFYRGRTDARRRTSSRRTSPRRSSSSPRRASAQVHRQRPQRRRRRERPRTRDERRAPVDAGRAGPRAAGDLEALRRDAGARGRLADALPRRGARAARRERRRQVDADQDHDRHPLAGRGHDRASTARRSTFAARPTRSGRDRRDLPGAGDLPRPQRRREHLHRPPGPRRARALAADVRARPRRSSAASTCASTCGTPASGLTVAVAAGGRDREGASRSTCAC